MAPGHTDGSLAAHSSSESSSVGSGSIGATAEGLAETTDVRRQVTSLDLSNNKLET